MLTAPRGHTLSKPDVRVSRAEVGRPKGRAAERRRLGILDTGMRLPALTLIVLIASWNIIPATAVSCPANSTGQAIHGHARGAPSHSHASDSHSHSGDAHSHADAGHGDTGHHAEAAWGHAGRTPLAANSQPSCCEPASDARVVLVVLQNAPRPKVSTAVLLPVAAAATPMSPWATASQLRRRQPPPLPYERTRRPLLI